MDYFRRIPGVSYIFGASTPAASAQEAAAVANQAAAAANQAAAVATANRAPNARQANAAANAARRAAAAANQSAAAAGGGGGGVAAMIARREQEIAAARAPVMTVGSGDPTRAARVAAFTASTTRPAYASNLSEYHTKAATEAMRAKINEKKYGSTGGRRRKTKRRGRGHK